jgi:repressor LexA
VYQTFVWYVHGPRLFMGKTPPGQTRERVYTYMQAQLLQGHSPTLREAQLALGFRALETVREHLSALVEEGRLIKAEGRARGYRLAQQVSQPVVYVPVLGRVAAGVLTTAVEEHEGYVAVQVRSSMDGLFGLRVRGESMVGAGILPGDIVIVRKQAKVCDGDIVVAVVDDDATVKRLRTRRGKLELCPENPAFEVITVHPKHVHVLGKVIEVRRDLEAAMRQERVP